MYDYYTHHHKPNEKKYIQVNVIDLYNHIKKNHGGENVRKEIHDMFCDHHCDVFRNDSMFVFERFFQGDDSDLAPVWAGEPEGNHQKALYFLKTFCEKHGYKSYDSFEEFMEQERSCIFPGYDGILMDVMW